MTFPRVVPLMACEGFSAVLSPIGWRINAKNG